MASIKWLCYGSLQNRIDMLETLSNLDAAEAMFDGIMQAVVCREVVGWREDARRLLLVLTDNGYHIAGDGRVCHIIAHLDYMDCTHYDKYY